MALPYSKVSNGSPLPAWMINPLDKNKCLLKVRLHYLSPVLNFYDSSFSTLSLNQAKPPLALTVCHFLLHISFMFMFPFPEIFFSLFKSDLKIWSPFPPCFNTNFPKMASQFLPWPKLWFSHGVFLIWFCVIIIHISLTFSWGQRSHCALLCITLSCLLVSFK